MSFSYKIPVPTTDANCKSTFTRTFVHTDWVDGQDVVEAASDGGFNVRLHKIEADLDALSGNLATAFNCINLLRSQVCEVLSEISSLLTPAKTTKDSKDNKEAKDTKDVKDVKDGKDDKDVKDVKDGKDAKEGKDGKDNKDSKDVKDTKDHKEGKDLKDKDGKDGLRSKEKEDNVAPALFMSPGVSPQASMLDFLFAGPAPINEAPLGRAFIRPGERPEVGARALNDAEG